MEINMEVIYNPMVPISDGGTAVAFGTFDGLHKGHMGLMNQLLNTRNYKRVVYTFCDNPSKIVHNINIKYIISQEYKEKLIADLGIDFLVVQDFTKDFMNKEAEAFFYDYMIGILKAKVIIVGYNFSFGKNNKGDISLLQRLCSENGVTLFVIPPVKVDDVIVSSTHIRDFIIDGDLAAIKKTLGRPFTVYQKVVKGNQLGRTIGFPTANMLLDDGQALPPDGVYTTSVTIQGKTYAGVSNLGGRPTIEQGYRALETNIMGYDGDLYDKTLAIEFHKKLRDIKRFGSLEELKAQITVDSKKAKEYFENKLFTS